jgi:hypothetical protein
MWLRVWGPYQQGFQWHMPSASALFSFLTCVWACMWDRFGSSAADVYTETLPLFTFSCKNKLATHLCLRLVTRAIQCGLARDRDRDSDTEQRVPGCCDIRQRKKERITGRVFFNLARRRIRVCGSWKEKTPFHLHFLKVGYVTWLSTWILLHIRRRKQFLLHPVSSAPLLWHHKNASSLQSRIRVRGSWSE